MDELPGGYGIGFFDSFDSGMMFLTIYISYSIDYCSWVDTKSWSAVSLDKIGVNGTLKDKFVTKDYSPFEKLFLP
jgi:hypothetical protein